MALLRDTTGTKKIVIYLNAIIRFAQSIVAAVALGVYAHETSYWVTHGVREWAMIYEIVLGSLSLVTALAFALVSYILCYRPVAFGALWDIVLMVAWGSAYFGMRAAFWQTFDEFIPWFTPIVGTAEYWEGVHHWNTMFKAAYLNLAGMVLFMTSALMGFSLLSVGSDFRSHLLN